MKLLKVIMPIALSGGITLSGFGNNALYEVFIDNKEVNSINELDVIQEQPNHSKQIIRADSNESKKVISEIESDLTVNDTNFPDETFRKYLIDTYGNTINSEELSNITSIKLKSGYQGTKIQSVKGIEYFKNLTVLEVDYNQLSELDVTENPHLRSLSCYDNQLSSLDISQNTELYSLNVGYNSLNELNIINNTELVDLECGRNKLTQLDVSNNKKLKTLGCHLNKLSTLNLGNNSELSVLFCNQNKLSNLDLKKIPSL